MKNLSALIAALGNTELTTRENVLVVSSLALLLLLSIMSARAIVN